jgi:phage terminase small subunit
MNQKDMADLSPESRAWTRGILKSFVLESHHEKLLLTCGQALDRIARARELVRKEGEVYSDNHGVRRPHPAVKMENDAKILFARCLRELDLDGEPTPASRAPSLRSNRSLAAIRGGKHHAA